jgi:hypothetical protein
MGNLPFANLRSRFGKRLIMDRIRAFYATVNEGVRKLNAEKVKMGICVLGLSCMNAATHDTHRKCGGSCEACWRKRRALEDGKRDPLFRRYQTEYGKIRRAEIDAEIARRQEKSGKTKSKKKADVPKRKAA